MPIDFIIIGAQKAGTTALFDYLGEHPSIVLPDEKELHFFDDEETVDWSQPDYSAYERRFPAAGPGRLRGEATPIYSYWPRSLERIAGYNPAARLILVLRDPVERAWSHWRMEFARGWEKQPFAWCIRAGRQRPFRATPWGHHRAFSYVERGFYGEQVERAIGLFGREQLLVLSAEALRRDPDAVLAQVGAFLGLAAWPPVAPREVHVGPRFEGGADPEPADVFYLREVYAADQARLRALTGFGYDRAP